MCGRYTLIDTTAAAAELRRWLDGDFPAIPARYNVAPSQLNPTVAAEDPGRPRVAMMRWGLAPFWDRASNPRIAPINARAEGILGKPMFRQSVQRRRCLAPADGFYEWKSLAQGTKIPHFIRMRNRAPFFLAGIFEAGLEGRPETYAILTTRANALMLGLHDRMPVILGGETARKWLAPGPLGEESLAALCAPCAADEMEAFPVARVVNSPKNDGPECIVPAAGSDRLFE